MSWEVPGLEGAPVANQYLVYTKGRAYILTYATTSGRAGELASTFERSARSFSLD